MEIQLHSRLCTAIPHLKVGIIHYDNIIVEESPQLLKGKLQFFQETLYFDLESKNLKEIREINEWRAIFKQLGRNPNRYRHSAEALLLRIQKQNFIPSLHSAVDLNNFFSLKYLLPISLYDKDQINGKVEMRVGEKGEQYEGLNGRVIDMEGFLLSADDLGPFGSPFVDSTRTAVSSATKYALQIVYLVPSISSQQAKELLDAIGSMFTQINGGNATTALLSCSSA